MNKKFKPRNSKHTLDNYKHLHKYFKNPDDAKNYSRGSDRYIDCICPLCGYEKQVRAHNLFWNGFSCPKCKNKPTSYPERFLIGYLEVKGIDYQYQFKVPNERRYIDFYLPELNIAIEAHGEQHYNARVSSKWKDSFEKSKKSTNIKRKYCMENNINFVELDCSISKYSFISKSINNSILPDIEEHEVTQILEKSINYRDEKTVSIIEDIKKGIVFYKISKKHNVDSTHVHNIAERYNLKEKYYKDGRGMRKIYCYETDKVYPSMSQTCRELNVSGNNIIYEYFKGKTKYVKSRDGKKYTMKFVN